VLLQDGVVRSRRSIASFTTLDISSLPFRPAPNANAISNEATVSHNNPTLSSSIPLPIVSVNSARSMRAYPKLVHICDPNGNNLVAIANSCTAMGRRCTPPSEWMFIAVVWMCSPDRYRSRPRDRIALVSGSVRTVGTAIGIGDCVDVGIWVWCGGDLVEGQLLSSSLEQIGGVAFVGVFVAATLFVAAGLVVSSSKRRPSAIDLLIVVIRMLTMLQEQHTGPLLPLLLLYSYICWIYDCDGES